MSGTHEKSAVTSKKFIAYLIAEATWKIIMVVALLVFREEIQSVGVWAWWFLIAVLLVAGFVEVTYIGGQAALDKYVRVAEIASRGPASESPKEAKKDEPST